jgi:hypothetical protein
MIGEIEHNLTCVALTCMLELSITITKRKGLDLSAGFFLANNYIRDGHFVRKNVTLYSPSSLSFFTPTFNNPFIKRIYLFILSLIMRTPIAIAFACIAAATISVEALPTNCSKTYSVVSGDTVRIYYQAFNN